MIQKVGLWRQLHNGVLVKGKMVRYSLGDAAIKVGVKKKTLDDYLRYLRLARIYGFSFNEHLDEKIGVIRRFVLSRKSQEVRKLERL